MSKNRQKGRRGFSLVELLIAVIVLGILTLISIQVGSSAQERARKTAAMTALENYKSSFSSVMLTWPGMMKDREDAWGTDGSAYTGMEAYKRLTARMNETLELKLQFVWDSELKCYKSQSEDPWGGYYVLTEFPMADGDTDGVSPLTGKGRSAMRIGIWSTGSDEAVIIESKVSDKTVGLSLEYRSGYVYDVFNGTENSQSPYAGFSIERK